MWGLSHRLSTIKAFRIFREIVDNVNDIYLVDHIINSIAESCVDTDNLRDLELVDVDWGIDNPHEDTLLEDSDEAHYSRGGRNFTSFNHFIDIKKGPGLFDDYDGYSYKKGSASKGEHQDVSDVTEIEDVETFFAEILSRSVEFFASFKVDEGVNYWLNDEYVHACCHEWYENCSPSTENYSFPEDKGIYSTVKKELAARFPRAACIGWEDKGIPYSVFMPVDNLARFWYSLVLATKNVFYLGPVLHAIQDASVPHHAAGYNGNWHINYERDMNSNISNWLKDSSFKEDVENLVEEWNKEDGSPPNTLGKNDWDKVPAKNWRIDRLVTWVALNAYREYAGTYNHFSNGYTFNANSMRNLTKIAVAMSVLFLIKATEEAGEPLIEGELLIANYIGNKNTKELHRPGCHCVTMMHEENKVFFSTLSRPLEELVYNGCYYCLREYDTG